MLQGLVLSSRRICLPGPPEGSSLPPGWVRLPPLELLGFSSVQKALVDPIYSQVTQLSESQAHSLLVIFSVNLLWQCGPANAEVGRKLHQMGEIRGHHFVLFGQLTAFGMKFVRVVVSFLSWNLLDNWEIWSFGLNSADATEFWIFGCLSVAAFHSSLRPALVLTGTLDLVLLFYLRKSPWNTYKMSHLTEQLFF